MAIALGTGRKPKKKRQSVRQRRHRGGTKWGTILLVGVLLYFGYSSYGQLRLMMELKRELVQVEQAITVAKQRSKEINAQITYLKSDSYVEKTAREELGLVRPGEIIFMPESSPAVD
ncbi:MAG: FtsB family cell division protein [bacterium]